MWKPINIDYFSSGGRNPLLDGLMFVLVVFFSILYLLIYLYWKRILYFRMAVWVSKVVLKTTFLGWFAKRLFSDVKAYQYWVFFVLGRETPFWWFYVCLLCAFLIIISRMVVSGNQQHPSHYASPVWDRLGRLNPFCFHYFTASHPTTKARTQ
jgi:hypothetical protein